MDNRIKDVLLALSQKNEYMKALGLEIVSLTEGDVTGRIPVTDWIKNPYGSVHGGVLYALADILSGFCACTYGHYVSTINGSLNYLKPATGTKFIYCHANMLHPGRKVAQVSVLLTDDAGTLLDTGIFAFSIMDKEVISCD